MVYESIALGLTVVACYAMRLRVEWLRDAWSKRLADAMNATTRAAEQVARCEADIERLLRAVTALQGQKNAEAFGRRS